MKKMKKVLLIALLIFTGLIALLFLAFNHKTSTYEVNDPTGSYVAKYSARTFYSLIPMPLGSSGDKPGFVEIFNKSGDSMGQIPIPMFQLGAVNWTATGANVQMIGEWDFVNGSCYYWDETDTKKIFVKGYELNPHK